MEILGMQVEVDLWLWIVSQIAALVALIFICWGFLVKEKHKTLFLLAIGCIFYTASAAFLFNWVIVGVIGIMVIQNLLYSFFEKGYPSGQ